MAVVIYQTKVPIIDLTGNQNVQFIVEAWTCSTVEVGMNMNGLHKVRTERSFTEPFVSYYQ